MPLSSILSETMPNATYKAIKLDADFASPLSIIRDMLDVKKVFRRSYSIESFKFLIPKQ